jgi:mitogen-activated protein kinase 1/3
MLTVSQYTTAVDLWSVGCILAELLIFKPLFPGKDYKHQLQLIFDFIGVPRGEDLAWIKSSRARSFIKSLCPSGTSCAPDPEIVLNSIPERIMRHGDRTINPLAIDLLKKLLIFDPRKRITVEQALIHPYVAKYHDVSDEPTARVILPEEFTFDTDQNKIMMSDLKVKLYNEIL